MSKEIRKVTIAVACVVAGENCKIGDDVDVSKEDGAYLVGAKRAVVAGSDEAKEIKEAVKAAAKDNK